MTRLKKSVLFFITGLLLVSYIGFDHVFLLNSMPKVLSSERVNESEQACMVNEASTAIDHNGEFNIGIWNIYKQQKPKWLSTLHRLIKKNDLVLIQEARLSAAFLGYLRSSSSVYFMAEAFKIGRTSVGVMTISHAMSLSTCVLLSAEPWIRFPKSTLASIYPLSNGQELLVVNLHGINFDWRLTHYKAQLKAVSELFLTHKGPAILAGDFNTWRQERQALVTAFAKQWQLTEAKFTIDNRTLAFGYPLDHLYYRGLTLIDANAFETKTSDHNPITASFRLEQAH